MPAMLGLSRCRRGSSCAVLGLLLGCTSLPSIPSGVCGNAIVEPSAGEDCDTFDAEEGARCLPPGTVHECRYQCSIGAEGDETPCPTGMGCGGDGICRTPTGTYEPGAAFDSPAFDLLSADFDGDGRDDVLAVTDDAFAVRYFDEAGLLEGSLDAPRVATLGTSPAVGELTLDHRADIVMPQDRGIFVAIGDEGRRVQPTAHTTVSVQNLEGLALASAEVNVEHPGDEIIALGTINGGTALVYVPLAGGVITVLSGMPLSAERLSGPLLLEHLDTRPSSPCGEAVLGYEGEVNVFVYPVCSLDADGNVVQSSGAGPLRAVVLQGAVVAGPVQALDVDRDGHLDLIVCARRGEALEVSAAYGAGDGTFHSVSGVPPTTGGDQLFGTYAPLDTEIPVTFGHLDEDDVIDLVLPTEIRVSAGGVLGAVTVAASGDERWAEAVIRELNGNGFPDVVTAETRGLQFFNGTGRGRLVATTLATQGLAHELMVGDFDGDAIADFIVAERVAGADEPRPDAISVFFGRAYGVPEPAVGLGRLDAVVQTFGNYGTLYTIVDGIHDFVVVSDEGGGTFSFAGFAGRSDRALRSPYTTTETFVEGTSSNVPQLRGYGTARIAVGDATGDGHADVVSIGHNPDFDLHMLWVTPVEGAALFASADAAHSEPLATDVDWWASVLVSVDLDADGADELLALAPRVDDPTQGVSVVARFAAATGDGGGPGVVEVDDAREIGWAFMRAEAPEGPPRGETLRTGDIDGDGDADICALSRGPSGGRPKRRVVVFENDGSGRLGAAREVPAPEQPLAFTLVQADTDPSLELAVLEATSIRVIGYDAQADEFEPGTVTTVPDAGMQLIAAGDLDGDGVDDLALSDGGLVRAMKGKPSLP